MKSMIDAITPGHAALLLLLATACGASPAPRERAEPAPTPPLGSVDHVTWQRGATSIALQGASDGTAAQLVLSAKGGTRRLSPDGTWESLAEGFPAQLVDVQDGVLWLAYQGELRLVVDGKMGDQISLPKGSQSNALELGFDGSAFVADTQANRIYWVQASQVEVFSEGEALQHPRALLLNGGSLVVGGESGVFSISIATGERTELASGSPVVGLALDHLGYVIVADSEGVISQIQPEGTMKVLHQSQTPITSIAFDEDTRRLYVASAETISTLSYLELTGESTEIWSARDQRPMRAVSRHGMTLSGAEFWPSHGTTNVSYPDDILWGFYPSPEQVLEGSSAAGEPSEAAAQCAEKSYQALMQFFDSNPEAFHQAVSATGSSNRFYLWVNDYSDAAADFPHEKRMNKFWYWQREPAVKGRVPGFWKWETTVLQDGSCLWPEAAQIAAYLADKIVTAP